MSALFILETGQVLGYVHNLPYDDRFHTAMFCPACGQIWGRVLYDKAVQFTTRHKSCLNHGDGSFFLSIDDMDSITLPEALASHEAVVSLLHLSNYENYHRWPIQVTV